jgi:hypothetical protein
MSQEPGEKVLINKKVVSPARNMKKYDQLRFLTAGLANRCLLGIWAANRMTITFWDHDRLGNIVKNDRAPINEEWGSPSEHPGIRNKGNGAA